MSKRVASETEIFGDERFAPLGCTADHRLAKIKVGGEIAPQAGDLDIGEVGPQVRERVVPTNLAIGDHFEAGFQLVGDSAADHFVFGVEEVRGVAFAAVERCGGATENLTLQAVSDARIAAGICEVQTGKHWIMRRTHAHSLLKGFGMTLDETDGSVKARVDLLPWRAKARTAGNRMQRPSR